MCLLLDRVLGRALESWLLREAEVMAGAEVQVIAAADREVGPLPTEVTQDTFRERAREREKARESERVRRAHTHKRAERRCAQVWHTPAQSSRHVARLCSPKLR